MTYAIHSTFQKNKKQTKKKEKKRSKKGHINKMVSIGGSVQKEKKFYSLSCYASIWIVAEIT